VFIAAAKLHAKQWKLLANYARLHRSAACTADTRIKEQLTKYLATAMSYSETQVAFLYQLRHMTLMEFKHG